MSLRLADPIAHQTQPTPVSCTATCVAMAVGIDVKQLGVDLDAAYGFKDCGIWFAERGIWMRVCDRGERFHSGTLYLVSVRSLNKVGVDHALLLDTRALSDAGSHPEKNWRTFDPNEGREGKKIYTFLNEYYAIHACELKQHSDRYLRFGSPP